MKDLYKSIGLIAVSLTTACSSVSEKVEVPEVSLPQRSACTFERTTEPAPEWVCTGVMGDLVTGRGSYDRNNASENLSFQIAQQRARADLARKLVVEVKASLNDYESIAGPGFSERIDKHVEEVGKSEIRMPIAGSRVYASVTSPNGVKYVLVGIDEELAKKNKERFLRSSFKDSAAKWTKEEAQKAYSELEKLLREEH